MSAQSVDVRPSFLQQRHENGAAIVAAFRELPKADAVAVDSWLVRNSGLALSWTERCLWGWINESVEAQELFAALARCKGGAK